MPEESSAPNPPAGRRRNASEESGGGGKMLNIILILLVLGLGFALFKAKSGGGTEIEAALTNKAYFSNQIAQLEVKVKEGVEGIESAKSNHLAAFARQTAQMMSISNRLVQTQQHLEREEAALHNARNEVSAKATSVGALEVQRDEWQRQASVVPGLEREIAGFKERLNDELFKYRRLEETLGRVTTEKADLERKLEDPLFLRRQALRVEEAAELRRRAGANQPVKLVDPRVLLDLQPDGSVRPSVATAVQPKPK